MFWGGACGAAPISFDGFVKSLKTPFSVIPAEAGTQSFYGLLDSRRSLS